MSINYLPRLPTPDTHCVDEDTGEDVWSYSADQVYAYAEQALSASEREKRAIVEDAISLINAFACMDNASMHDAANKIRKTINERRMACPKSN